MPPAIAIGLWVALAYTLLATAVIVADRGPHRGGWINLSGLLSHLATFPVSHLADRCGHRLDHRRNTDMACAVLGTACCVALLVALLVWPFVA